MFDISTTIPSLFIQADSPFLPQTSGGAGISVNNAWKNSSNATSTAVTVAPTAGHACFVLVVDFNGVTANHAVSDNIDGTTGWTTALLRSDSTGTFGVSAWVKFSMPSGVTTITCTGGSGAAISQGCVHEVTGVTTATVGEYSVSANTTTATPTSPTITNATANSVYFAFSIYEASSGNPTTFSINTAGTDGAFLLKSSTNSQELDADDLIVYSVPHQIVSSSAARKHVWTGLFAGDNSKSGMVVLH